MPSAHLPVARCLRPWTPCAARSRRCAVVGLCLLLISIANPTARAAVPDFETEVMAVLSKAGCNMGTCHGNQNGKGGFRLSLRGQDAKVDYDVLTRDGVARRINPVEPLQSLLLQKPTMQVAHEGGRRFADDSPEFRILAGWIAAGMPRRSETAQQLAGLKVTPLQQVLFEPRKEVQLSVTAVWADGSQTDVTHMAVYTPADPFALVSHGGLVELDRAGETTVAVRFLDQQQSVRVARVVERPGFEPAPPPSENVVDRHVYAKLARLRLTPSRRCDDSVFLRRTHLDLLGRIPTADEARSFMTNTRPDKRQRLVRELLKRPGFADYWAMKWSDLLRVEEKTLDRKGVQNYHNWIRSSIAENKPVNQFVAELIASRGSTYTVPPANYYRSMREPLQRGESTAQLFLGVRLQCAKCHNHPFDQWTQADYYGWANLFARVDYKILENQRRDRNDKHEFNGEQIVFMADKGEVENPRTGQPQPPRFLSPDAKPLPENADRLLALSEWLTAADNRQFARVQVNRIWYHLMGRGLVDPIDDFRVTNPATHPELLEELTDQFIASGFDLRQLLVTVIDSETYQHASEPRDGNQIDEQNYARVIPRRLGAEQLLDSMSQAAARPVAFNGYPHGVRACQLPGVQAIRLRDQTPSLGDQFLRTFGRPARLQTCECERTDQATLEQTLVLVNGGLMNELLTTRPNRLSRLVADGTGDAEAVDELFWASLSRAPTDEEKRRSTEYLNSAADRSRALEDLCWALMSSQEFLLRY